MTERSPERTDADGDARTRVEPGADPSPDRETERTRETEPDFGTAADADAAGDEAGNRDRDGDGGEFPGEAVLGTTGDPGRERPPMEPEAVSPENAAFVLLGVAFTVFVLATAL